APQEASPAKSAGPDADPEIEPVDPVQTRSLTAAIEAAMASSGTRGAPARAPQQALTALARSEAPPADQSEITMVAPAAAAAPDAAAPAGRGARPAWTPPADTLRQAATLQKSPLARVPLPPIPARPAQPNEGPRRPPLPSRQGPAVGPLTPGLGGKPARAPWPDG